MKMIKMEEVSAILSAGMNNLLTEYSIRKKGLPKEKDMELCCRIYDGSNIMYDEAEDRYYLGYESGSGIEKIPEYRYFVILPDFHWKETKSGRRKPEDVSLYLYGCSSLAEVKKLLLRRREFPCIFKLFVLTNLRYRHYSGRWQGIKYQEVYCDWELDMMDKTFTKFETPNLWYNEEKKTYRVFESNMDYLLGKGYEI